MFILIRNFYYYILSYFPVLLLFFLVLTDLDFSLHPKNSVTFNFIYIVIYYWVLRKPEVLGYGLIFFAGVINDIVVGLPIGISPINFLFLSGIASYFRNITLRPSLVNDWIAFFPSLLIVSSIHYSVLKLVFDIDINYLFLILSSLLTTVCYPLAGIVFNVIIKILNPEKND